MCVLCVVSSQNLFETLPAETDVHRRQGGVCLLGSDGGRKCPQRGNGSRRCPAECGWMQGKIPASPENSDAQKFAVLLK